MLNRCHGPGQSADTARYRDRGIVVCSRWRESFEVFLADMGERPDGTTLDRIDGSRGYSPDNCRWATRKTQQNNASFNHRITLDGVTYTLQEWAYFRGINHRVVRNRLKRGWSPERALTEPVHPRR